MSSCLRRQGRLPLPSTRQLRNQEELCWAVYSCSLAPKTKTILEFGADPRGRKTGFRSKTGNVLHPAAIILNHIQGPWLPLDSKQCQARKVKNIALLLQSGADQDATPFDYMLALVRKFHHRRALQLWRAALEFC